MLQQPSDADLLADLDAVRRSFIAQGIVCFAGPDAFMRDLLDAMGGPPPGVIVIETRLLDADPLPVADPNLSQNLKRALNFPTTEASERRTAEQQESEAAEVDPIMLERIVRMSRRRQLKMLHTGPTIRLTSPDGEVRYDGSIEQVYEALRQDTIARLPPSRADQLRERLTRAVAWGAWTLTEDHDGRYTICKDDERMFSGTLEQLEQVAASRILNSTPGWGYSLGNPES